MKKLYQLLIKRFSYITIKRQLLLLTFITSILLLVTQFFYIYKSHHTLQNVTVNYTDRIIKQKISNIETFINGMIDSSQALSENISVQEYLKSSDYAIRYQYLKPIRGFIKYILSSNSSILDIAIIDHDEHILSNGNVSIFKIHEYLSEHYTGYASNEFESFFDMVTTSDGTIYFVYVRPVTPPFSSTHMASCITVFNNYSIQTILNEISLTKNARLFLYNENNIILAADDYVVLNTELPEPLAITNEPTYLTFQEHDFFVNSYNIPNTQWKLLYMIPRNQMTNEMSPYTILSIFFMGITIIILIMFLHTCWQNIASPIYHLKIQLEDIGQSGRHKRIQSPLHSENEIMQIGHTINTMLDKIEDLNQKIFQTQASLYEAELLKREAEFYALQNQINPHFLYNTLDCIRDISLVYNVEEISSISISLSKMLRYCIINQTFVKIADELECIKHYLTIMQIRYQNRFQIEIDIDPQICQFYMLKFLLQPLIENAFYHGLEQKSGTGYLKIHGRMTLNNAICFEIYDTGIGINSQKLLELNSILQNSNQNMVTSKKHTGIGLMNIHHRVKAEYGYEYGLTLDSKYKEWTRVTLHFPIEKRKE